MPIWRVTIRHGRPQRYHVEDVEAPDLAAVLRAAAELAAGAPDADLAELRLAADPESRDYTPG